MFFLGVELASSFENVIGIDLSNNFLPLLEKRRPQNLTAFVADALDSYKNPRIASRKYNLIVGANLLDRIADPAAWIQQCKNLLEDDGIFILFTPFTWMQDYTDEKKWLGGIRENAEVVWSLRGTVDVAAPELSLCERSSHVPFIIPDADGSQQYTFSQCMVFCKRKRFGLLSSGVGNVSGIGYVDEGDENYATPQNQ